MNSYITTIDTFTQSVSCINIIFIEGKGFATGTAADGTPVYNNWTNAKHKLEHAIKRRLSPADITVLSLCLRFGPTPYLGEVAEEQIWQKVWPKGTPMGGFKSPTEVLEIIKQTIKKE